MSVLGMLRIAMAQVFRAIAEYLDPMHVDVEDIQTQHVEWPDGFTDWLTKVSVGVGFDLRPPGGEGY